MSKTLCNRSCRLCGRKEQQVFLNNCITYLDETYALYRCSSCGFVTTDPVPGPEILSKYYDDEYWSFSDNDANKSIDRFYEFRMAPALRTIKKYVPTGGKILDCGAGNGAWVNMVTRAGFDALGLDQYSAPQDNEVLISGDLKKAELEDNFFDAITCFHVLEHLVDPVDSFKIAIKKLKRGGIMMIEVPNIDSLAFYLLGKRWQPLELPTHLNHFNPETLDKIILDSGADIITKEFFSLRASPSVPVLSVFPGLTPKLVRRLHHGRYPLPLKLLYLLLQMMVCPLCMITAMKKRGSIMRIILIKK